MQVYFIKSYLSLFNFFRVMVFREGSEKGNQMLCSLTIIQINKNQWIKSIFGGKIESFFNKPQAYKLLYQGRTIEVS